MLVIFKALQKKENMVEVHISIARYRGNLWSKYVLVPHGYFETLL